MPARAPVRLPRRAERLLAALGVDWEPPTRQPPAGRVVLATVVALVGSLVADALLVAAGTHLFPSTRGFAHFRPLDYGSLTVVGVLAACAGWPVVVRVSSAPRRLFFRLAILVTVVLLAPDAWILLRGEPARAVAVLATMHLAIALVTYNVLVAVAPAGRRRHPRRGDTPSGARRAAAARALRGDAVTQAPEPAGRGTAYPSLPPDAAYGPDGIAIAVPVDAPVARGATAIPATGAMARGGVRSAFEAPVVPLRPRAAPPVGGGPAGGSQLPLATSGQVPVVRRLEADVPARTAGATAADPDPVGTVPRAAPDLGTGARRSGRRSKGGHAATGVARPPATLPEPRSAVRLLPPPSSAGVGANAGARAEAGPAAGVGGGPRPTPLGRDTGDERATDARAGIGPPVGRHARDEGGTSDDGRADVTGRWRRGQRGRHVARS